MKFFGGYDAFEIFICFGIIAMTFSSMFSAPQKNVTPVDYDSAKADEYKAVAQENAVLPFSAGINVNGLEGDWSYKRAMSILSDETTYENIKRQGFDHIRIPIDFRLIYSESTKSFNEKEIAKIDNVLDLVEKSGLYATIDFHGWYDITPRDKAAKETFLTIWGLVAERYKDRSELISFELMNEPGMKLMSIKEHNDLQAEAIAVIRKTNPDRLIICAAPDGNQPWTLKDLVLPEGDKNLAVAVHIYHPGDFTHQGFTWAGRPANVQVRLDEKGYKELMWNINETQKFIDETGIPVILNEFGLNLSLADREDSAKYLGSLTSFCQKNGIPWTYWQYHDDHMGLYHRGRWDVEAMDALFLKEE